MLSTVNLNLINYEVNTSKKGVLYVRIILFDPENLDKVILFGFAELVDSLKSIKLANKYGTPCTVILYIDPATLKIRVNSIEEVKL